MGDKRSKANSQGGEMEDGVRHRGPVAVLGCPPPMGPRSGPELAGGILLGYVEILGNEKHA